MPTNVGGQIVYTDEELVALWIRNGGPRGKNGITAWFAMAVAHSESGNVANKISPTGDYGLWAINRRAHPEWFAPGLNILDADTNAKAAIAISLGGKNWRPWCTAWSDNACGTRGGKYLDAGGNAVAYLADRSPTIVASSTINSFQNLGTIPDAVGGETATTGAINKLLGIGTGSGVPSAADACIYSWKGFGAGPLSTGPICFDTIAGGLKMALGGFGAAVTGLALVWQLSRQVPGGAEATRASGRVVGKVGPVRAYRTVAKARNRRVAVRTTNARRAEADRRTAVREQLATNRDRRAEQAAAARTTRRSSGGTVYVMESDPRYESMVRRSAEREARRRSTGTDNDAPPF